MAVLRINLGPAGLAPHGQDTGVEAALAAAPDGPGPVIVMIHGFKFAPGDPLHCPHEHILSDRDDNACWKALSWPRELGLCGDDAGGLGIAFGWPARGSIWQAYDGAALAGAALAALILALHARWPGRPVHAIAHSLGARVVLSALPHLPAGALGRAVLLAGAEYAGRAEAALASPAGRTVDVISVTSRENRPYDRLLERLIAAPRPGDTALGRSQPAQPNWLTLPLDDAALLARLAQEGFAIAAPERWICHWSAYLRPGVFALYRALLADRQGLPLARLRQALPEPAAPRRHARRRLRLPQLGPAAPVLRNLS